MATKASKFQTGTEVGAYRLLREISDSGNMAWVYEAAVINNPDRRVAIKITRSDHAAPDIVENLLINETRVLQDYKHPGIIHLYPIMEGAKPIFNGRAINLKRYFKDSPWYYVMEMLRGGSLESLSENGRLAQLSIEWKLELLYQILLPMDYLHLRNFSHRDIKMDNIVLRNSPSENQLPQPVLIDFGIAGKKNITKNSQHFGANTLTHASPEYLEELTGLKPKGYKTTLTTDVDNRPSDIWALGVVAYQMFSGKLPFEYTGDKDALILQILNIKPKPLHAISRTPKSISSLVEKMLIPIRENRPTAAQVIRMIETETEFMPPRLNIK